MSAVLVKVRTLAVDIRSYAHLSAIGGVPIAAVIMGATRSSRARHSATAASPPPL